MSNDWGKPFTPEELAKLPGAKQVTTVWPDYQQVPKPEYVEGPDAWPTHPDQLSPMTVGPEEWGENPTCYAWHPESGCGIIFSDRDALNEALEAEPLLVEMTKEEYDEASKIAAADWPGPMGEAVKNAVAAEVETQSELTRALETIMAPGFGEREPLTTDDPEHPDCVAPFAERTAPVETFSEADGPWYVVYFGPVLYTVLAGPYDTQEAAAERIDRVWAQFEHDAAYDYSFPTRERSGLRATTVRSVFNLKGAYGKQ